MLRAFIEIEEFMGREAAIIRRKTLRRLFGEEAVEKAVTQGWLREYHGFCNGHQGICYYWLTAQGKKAFNRTQGLDPT